MLEKSQEGKDLILQITVSMFILSNEIDLTRFEIRFKRHELCLHHKKTKTQIQKAQKVYIKLCRNDLSTLT